MKEPLLSIIVPVYKVEKYLNQCIDTIIGHSNQNIEVILEDAGLYDDLKELTFVS
jgi:glycosyltransferase involved in cell wall biosynthesis